MSDRDPSIDGFPTTWGHLRFKKHLIWLKMSMSFQKFSCDLYLGVLESHATSQVTRVTFSAHCFDTTDGKTSGLMNVRCFPSYSNPKGPQSPKHWSTQFFSKPIATTIKNLHNTSSPCLEMIVLYVCFRNIWDIYLVCHHSC